MLSSTSSLATFSKAAFSNRSQSSTSRYCSPLVAPHADSSFFRKRSSSSSCWGAKRGRGGFLPPHHPGQSLGSGGGVSAPKGILRAGSVFFAGLLQPFVFCHEGLGVVAASRNLSLLSLIVLQIHHPEGGVSASSDASEFQMVSSVHSVRQSLPIHGSLLWSLRGSSGLHAGHGSGSEFLTVLELASALSARLANSGILPRVGSSFSEDGPPVVQFSRNSRQLRVVSACVAAEDFSSSEFYWTLSVSGLLQPRNESTSFS